MSTIKATQRLIYSGRDNLMLVCAARLWPMPNGDLICSWLSGSDNEPASDNCVAMSRSTDGGRTWSDAQILVESNLDQYNCIIFIKDIQRYRIRIQLNLTGRMRQYDTDYITRFDFIA